MKKREKAFLIVGIEMWREEDEMWYIEASLVGYNNFFHSIYWIFSTRGALFNGEMVEHLITIISCKISWKKNIFFQNLTQILKIRLNYHKSDTAREKDVLKALTTNTRTAYDDSPLMSLSLSFVKYLSGLFW